MRKLVLTLALASLVLPATAQAHFNLTAPPSIAKSTEGGKGDAPCGPDTATTGTPTPVTGGTMLPINISETVIHPGFYRFALSLTSPPSFPADNVVKDKSGMVLSPTSQGVSDSAAFEDPAKFPVLADHMFVHTDGKQPLALQGAVAVPNINCDKCTLQVIEFMANHGTNGPSAGFFYHHCALLKITADPNKPIFDPNAAAGGAGGASAGGASGAAGAAGASGGASGGSGGVSVGGAGGSVGVSGGGASAAGAPAAGGASAGGSATASGGAAGAQPSFAGDTPDGGGCSLGHHGSGSTAPALALLVGLLALRRRRVRG